MHIKFATGAQRGNHVVGVDDFNVVRGLNVFGIHHTLGIFAQAQRDFVAVVQLKHHTLKVQQHVHHVFLHTVKRGVLVQHAGNRNLGWRVPNHRRQQHPAQGIAQRVAVAALKGLQRNPRTVGVQGFDLDGFWL